MKLFNTNKPIIGMVHLQALPGSPLYTGDLAQIKNAALRDADALIAGGVHAIMIENFGDVPFYKTKAPRHTIAQITAIASAIRAITNLPLGINVLRNDGCAALAIAQAVDAQFIRVNILCGARLTDQGLIEGIAADLLRDRKMLGAQSIKIFADINVKHSAPLADQSFAQEVDDLIHRSLADALIVSGSGTGKATDLDELKTVKSLAGDLPILIGSGVTPQTINALAPHADGFIVGTSIKTNNTPTSPVDVEKVKQLVNRLT